MTVNENKDVAVSTEDVIRIQPVQGVDKTVTIGVDQRHVVVEWVLAVDAKNETAQLCESNGGKPGMPIDIVNLVFDKKKFIFEAQIGIYCEEEPYEFNQYDPINLNKSARNITLIGLSADRMDLSLCFKAMRNELANLTFNCNPVATPGKRIKSLDPDVIIIRR